MTDTIITLAVLSAIIYTVIRLTRKAKEKPLTYIPERAETSDGYTRRPLPQTTHAIGTEPRFFTQAIGTRPRAASIDSNSGVDDLLYASAVVNGAGGDSPSQSSPSHSFSGGESGGGGSSSSWDSGTGGGGGCDSGGGDSGGGCDGGGGSD